MNHKATILVCPLDWGLGHATRCIPIIKLLLLKNTKVIIAGSGNSLELLKQEFPVLESIILEGYHITYSKRGNMVLQMLRKLPAILFGIYKEHKKIASIIKEYHIDLVISDNRYGLFTKRTPSVFITHQLMIKCPLWIKFMEPLLYLINMFFVSKYTECWVPDYRGKINLSGDLSHKYPKLRNVYFIGPQSRLYKQEVDDEFVGNKYDLMVILSGPEPQRGILEVIVAKQLASKNIKAIVVLGNYNKWNNTIDNENIKVYAHLTSNEILKYIQQSNVILCRAGYSSIMDICALGKKAILIPTPGQTEQEYLAKYFMDKKIFFSQSQSNFDICEALEKAEEYEGIQLRINASLLNKRVTEIIKKIKKK